LGMGHEKDSSVMVTDEPNDARQEEKCAAQSDFKARYQCRN